MAKDKSDLVFDQIVGRIEPLTRFNRNSLKRNTPNVRVTTGKASWRFNAHMSNNKEEHTGRLRYGPTKCDSPEKLDSTAVQAYKKAYEELPERIRSWVASNERADNKLEPSNCFNGPKVFGHEYVCPNCLGVGSTKCPKCDTGYNICPECRGARTFQCSRCKRLIFSGNKGEEKCPKCGGKGVKNGQRCSYCKNGKIACTKCKGRLTVDCGKCHAAGQIRCPDKCEPLGRVPCRHCDQTGYHHILRIIECTVSHHWHVDLKDEVGEVRGQLNTDLFSLREIADVTQLPPVAKDDSVVREYDIESVITEMSVDVSEKKIELIGYGSKSKIFDFKNIVSILLQDDLSALERGVGEFPLRPWGERNKLFAVTRQFLESEVNIDIDNARYLTEHIVDRNYVDRAKNSIRASLQNLLAANCGLALFLGILAPTLVVLIGRFTGLGETVGGWIFLIAVTVGIVLWVLMERRAVNRVSLELHKDKPEKIADLLGKYYILWKFRGVVLTSSMALLGLAALILNLIMV